MAGEAAPPPLLPDSPPSVDAELARNILNAMLLTAGATGGGPWTRCECLAVEADKELEAATRAAGSGRPQASAAVADWAIVKDED